MRLLPSGPRAVLAEFDSLAEVMHAAAAWRTAALPGVREVVPAARTVLVVHDGTLDTFALTTVLTTPEQTTVTTAPTDVLIVPTRYDGADLAEVAARCGLTAEQVVALHVDATYTVAFCGFMPGFSYLVGLPAALHLPRRASPRPRVPAGSVAIAAEFTAVYPRESPGGWHLLGVTDLVLWDDRREPAATLPPGTKVRFESR